jgi:hypothetical protein
MAVSTARSRLAPTGLYEHQLQHFADHGWVVIEGVIDPDACRRCIDATERMRSRLAGFTPNEVGSTGFVEPHMYDAAFIETYTTPGLVEAIGQLMGVPEPRYLHGLATIADPLPPADRDRLRDPSTWEWHRDGPRVPAPQGTAPTDHAIVNAAMYFVPVSAEHGVTAFLDGSHKLDGHWPDEGKVWADVGDRFEVVQPTADAGSIVLFAGATLHAATPVLSDQRRFATFNWHGAPWVVSTRGRQPYLLERYDDERLRSLFREPPRHEFLVAIPE